MGVFSAASSSRPSATSAAPIWSGARPCPGRTCAASTCDCPATVRPGRRSRSTRTARTWRGYAGRQSHGWGHIAFVVDDVNAAREAVRENGGADVGEIVTLQTADGRRVTWCYVSDPEGNLVELQSWSNPS